MTYETLLAKLDTIIEKCYESLEATNWENVRPQALLAFMVLAKDLIKERDAINPIVDNELDAWVTGTKDSDS